MKLKPCECGDMPQIKFESEYVRWDGTHARCMWLKCTCGVTSGACFDYGALEGAWNAAISGPKPN